MEEKGDGRETEVRYEKLVEEEKGMTAKVQVKM